jgi:hypothetical protein
MRVIEMACSGFGDPLTNICPVCGLWDEGSTIAWDQATPEQKKHWDERGAPDNIQHASSGTNGQKE